MNIAALIGTLLALLSFCVIIVEVSLQSFVEVFIALGDGDDAPLSCKIAGLGVYYTSYDSSCLTPQQLADSRVPAEKFTSPTTEFKLLFPAQENFVAEVIPVNDALLDQLGPSAAPLKPLVKAVADTEFESCTQYMGEIHANMDNLFGALYGVLPLFGTFLFGETATNLTVAIAAVEGATPYQGGLLGTFLIASSAFLGTACPTLTGLDLFSPITNETLPCIANAYSLAAAGLPSEASDAQGLMLALANFISNNCPDDGSVTPQVCLGGLGAQGATTDSTPLLVAPTHNLCLLLLDTTCAVINNAQFMGLIASAGSQLFAAGGDLSGLPAPLLAVAQGAEQGLTAIGTYALLVSVMAPRFVQLFGPGFTGANIDSFLLDLVGLPGSIYAFPSTFNTHYDPCAFLLFLEAGIQVDIPSFALQSLADVNATVTECPFSVWWSGATEIAVAGGADADQISLFGAVNSLTQVCAGLANFNPTFNPQTCDEVFASVFMSLTYSSEFPFDSLALDPSGDTVFSLATEACEDDATDKEKITLAQILAGVAIGTGFLTFLAGIFSLRMATKAQLMLIFGGVLSFVTLAMNTAALLSVRSAPVYSSVGEPAVENEPVYKDGVDVLVALVAIILSAITGVVFLIAALAQMKGFCGASNEESEAKELAVPAEREDPDAKPSV